MSADPTDISSVITAAARDGITAELHAAMLLWSTSQAFADGQPADNPFTFIDLAMRLYAGALFKLDSDAARDYLNAIAERADPALPGVDRTLADIARADAWSRLRLALAKAARPVGGHC